LGPTLPTHGPTPAAGGQREEMVALVREGIQALPEPFRSILVMREYGDLSYEQLAETLEGPKGTAESRLFRARMPLRDWRGGRRGAEAAADLLPEEHGRARQGAGVRAMIHPDEPHDEDDARGTERPRVTGPGPHDDVLLWVSKELDGELGERERVLLGD